MYKKNYKILLKFLSAGLVALLLSSTVAFAAPTSPGSSSPTTPGALCLDDADTWVLCESTFTFGDTSARIAEIWATLLDATTAVIGGITSGDVTISEATPALFFIDTDTTDDDNSASYNVNCTDTATTTEDCDVTFTQQVAGADVNWLTVDADGVITFLATSGVTIEGMNILNDGTTTTFLGTSGDYNQIGNAAGTSHTLASEDDMQVTGKLEVDGIAYFDNEAKLGNDFRFVFGGANNAAFIWETASTVDAFHMLVDTTSKNIVVSDNANLGLAHDHGASANPTIFTHSVLSPNTDNGEFLGLSYLGLTAGTMETDRVGYDFTINSSAPFATATTTNRDGADIILQTSSPTNSGTIYGVTSVGANTASNGINLTADSFFVDGKAEFDGRVYLDGNATLAASTSLDVSGTNSAIAIGGGMISNRAAMTPDALAFSIGTTSRNLVFIEAGDESFDFAHAQSTNPTLFGHSANQSTTEWWSLTHNQTNVVADAGAGLWSFVDGVLVDQDTDVIGLNIDSEATTATNYGLNVVTGQGAAAAGITYGTTNEGLAVISRNPNAAGAGSFYFYRNLTAASTASPVMNVVQDHASDDQILMSFQQDGSGAAITVAPGRIVEYQGTDVASASTIAPLNGNVFELTGTTAVALITTTGWQEGGRLTLICNESVTINHATATSGSNVTILLAGAADLSCTANDTLTLVLSSTTAGGQAWREVGRAVI